MLSSRKALMRAALELDMTDCPICGVVMFMYPLENWSEYTQRLGHKRPPAPRQIAHWQQSYPCLATRDHIIPKQKGGHNRASNIFLICYNCNHRKGVQPLSRYLSTLNAPHDAMTRCEDYQNKIGNYTMPKDPITNDAIPTTFKRVNLLTELTYLVFRQTTSRTAVEIFTGPQAAKDARERAALLATSTKDYVAVFGPQAAVFAPPKPAMAEQVDLQLGDEPS